MINHRHVMNSVYVFQEKPDLYRDEKDKKGTNLPPFHPFTPFEV